MINDVITKLAFACLHYGGLFKLHFQALLSLKIVGQVMGNGHNFRARADVGIAH